MAAEAASRTRTLPRVATLRRDSKVAGARRLAVHAVRRLGWGIGDQAVSSLTNYAVAIFVAHSLAAAEFGAFSLAYTTYGLVLNASRGLCTDPLMIRFSGVDEPSWRGAVEKSTGAALSFGTIVGIVVLVAGAVLGGAARGAFFALALTLPVLMLQDCWRFSFFTQGRGFHAFLNDSIWAAVMLPALALLRSLGHADVFWFTFAWGGSAGIAAIAGIFQARLFPRPGLVVKWVRTQGDIGIRYLIQGVLSNVAFQVRGFGLGALVGLAAVGYLQASGTLMGPMTILFLGMSLVTLPEASRIVRKSPRKLPYFCLLVSGGLSATALAWAAVLLIAVPRGLGQVLLGPIWHHAYPLIVPQLLCALAQAAGGGAGTGISALGAAKRSLKVAVVITVLISVFTLAGAYLDGGAGSLIGMAIASAIGDVMAWVLFRAALRDYMKTARRGGRHRRVRQRRVAII
jgi:O-antigen/teichoic acid export membrane protein